MTLLGITEYFRQTIRSLFPRCKILYLEPSLSIRIERVILRIRKGLAQTQVLLDHECVLSVRFVLQ